VIDDKDDDGGEPRRNILNDSWPKRTRLLGEWLDAAVTAELFTPEEMGWVFMSSVFLETGYRVWEKPDGAHHVFAPGAPELIQRYVGDPKIREDE
jgi:hypothetical protein